MRYLRTGKAKLQTPFVPKTNTFHSYNGGKHKFQTGNQQKVSHFDQYNNVDKYQRIELMEELKKETQLKNQMREIRQRNPTDTNHKKWHRNHPQDGFYNSRQVFHDQ